MSNQRFGTYITTGNPTQDKINSFGGLLRGIRHRYGIVDINPALNSWVFSVVDNARDLAVKNSLSLIDQMWRGPLDNIPGYWTKAPYNVPVVTTDDTSHSFNQYPYYLDSNFRYLCKDAQQHLSDHKAAFTQAQKAVYVAQLGNFGSTGDYNGYKGKPTDSKFNIAAPDWMQYVHEEVLTMKAQMPAWLPLALNPDNDAKDWDWDVQQGISILKVGEMGHNYGANGEGTFFRRLIAALKSNPNFIFFSESEGIQDSPGWTNQDFFMLVASFLTSGAQILSVAGTDAITAVSLKFLNKWAGVNTGGFCVMKDQLDYADTGRFPVDKYGPVIDPAKQKAYDSNVKRINADTTTGNAAKAEKLSGLLANDINPARVKNIQATQPSYMFDDTAFYTNDGGVDLWPGNYERGLHFVNYDSASVGLQRVTDASANAYGRRCRQMLLSWVFDVDVMPASPKISVTFLDNNKRLSLKIAYGTSAGSRITTDVKGTGSGLWVTHTFDVPLLARSLKSPDQSMHDFQLQYTGPRPIVQMVEVE